MIQQLVTYPLHWVYKGITSLRNCFFDHGILKGYQPNVFSIGVGNLTVGGTGKTPMVNYLIQLLKDKNVGVISRGYGRKTKGFLEISSDSTAEAVGDEPLMLSKNNPHVNFFVSEDRVKGFKVASKTHPKISLFIFDDVFQHRYINPQLQILLTDYHRMFYIDYVLPYGRLRESRKGAKRADAIVVTKCPLNLSKLDKINMSEKILRFALPGTPIFFAHYETGIPFNKTGDLLNINSEVVLISALANNNQFANSLSYQLKILKHYTFRDHYDIPSSALEEIFMEFPNNPIVTTEKDWVKIQGKLRPHQLENLFVANVQVKIEESFSKYLHSQINKL